MSYMKAMSMENTSSAKVGIERKSVKCSGTHFPQTVEVRFVKQAGVEIEHHVNDI